MTSTFPPGAQLPSNTVDFTVTGSSHTSWSTNGTATAKTLLFEETQKLSFLVVKVALDSALPEKKYTQIYMHPGSALCYGVKRVYEVDTDLGKWPHLLDVTPGCFDSNGEMTDYMVTGDSGGEFPCAVSTVQPGFVRRLFSPEDTPYREAATGVHVGRWDSIGGLNNWATGFFCAKGHLNFREILEAVISGARHGCKTGGRVYDSTGNWNYDVISVHRTPHLERNLLPY